VLATADRYGNAYPRICREPGGVSLLDHRVTKVLRSLGLAGRFGSAAGSPKAGVMTGEPELDVQAFDEGGHAASWTTTHMMRRKVTASEDGSSAVMT
jgi:hypothetical protein